MKYSYDAAAPAGDPDVPVFDGISLVRVRGTSCATAGDIFGLQHLSNITNLQLTDVSITGALADVLAWTQCQAAVGVAVNVSPPPLCLSPG